MSSNQPKQADGACTNAGGSVLFLTVEAAYDLARSGPAI